MDSTGHSQSTDRKRRSALYDHWRLEVLRNAVDEATLAHVRQRALHSREVQADPELRRLIEEYIRSHRAELTRLQARRATTGTANPAAIFGRATGRAIDPRSEDILATQQHLEHEIRGRLAHFDEVEAAFLFERLDALQRNHADLIDAARVARIGQRVEALRQRRLRREAEIERLVREAEQASAEGDHDTAAQLVTRLSGIRLAHPELLPADHWQQIHRRIIEASSHAPHREAAAALMARERAVADELQALARVVHSFHRAARTKPHDSDEYRQAEAAYLQAVSTVRHHDTEWLSGTVLELVDLLEEWEDHPPDAEAALDRFIRQIKTQLHALYKEVRQIERERGDE